jgi:hypothetical protein
MENRFRQKTKTFYPFLFALFPVLFLYSYNIEEVSWRALLEPAAFCLVLAVLTYLVLRLALKNSAKAALVTFLFSFMAFSYGHFHNLAGNYLSRMLHISETVITLAWILVFCLLGILAVRLKKEPVVLSSFLSVFVSLLVLLVLAQIAWFHLGQIFSTRGKLSPLKPLAISRDSTLHADKFPDIYYLIFDRYASDQTLRDFYQFDNSDFSNSLKAKGFSIASESRCNYPFTLFSLSSSLNMTHLVGIVEKGPVKISFFHRLLQDHAVWRLLKSAGYKYIHFGSWYEGTKVNKHADWNFKGKGLFDLSHDFIQKFLETTVLAPALKNKVAVSGGQIRVLQTLKTLSEVPAIQGPKFVFAHVLLPHHPFLFGPGGEKTSSGKATGETQAAKYIDQLQFTNKKILWLIDELLSKSERPPVIILQSDEGPGEEEKPILEIAKYKKKHRDTIKWRIRCQILNAFYWPGVRPDLFYKTMTPVNTFRLLFNNYFGTHYELLEDRTYFGVGTKKKVLRFKEFPKSAWIKKFAKIE